jgi:hypothetical protein
MGEEREMDGGTGCVERLKGWIVCSGRGESDCGEAEDDGADGDPLFRRQSTP